MKHLKLVVVSAKGLKNVSFFSNMSPFIVISVAGLNCHDHIKTCTNHNGGRNPVWSFDCVVQIPDELALQQNRLTLVLQICTKGLFGNRDIGKVVVPLKQLFDSSIIDRVTLSVMTPSGKFRGELTFSYEFDDVLIIRSSPAANGGALLAPPVKREEKTKFLVSCIPEFLSRISGTVAGDFLSSVVL